jgi:hypothetical protein
MLCGHKNTCLINGAAEGVSLLEHHVASQPYDLSAVVTCLHVGHTLFQETLRGVGCSEKTYPTGPRAVQVSDGDDDVSVLMKLLLLVILMVVVIMTMVITIIIIIIIIIIRRQIFTG